MERELAFSMDDKSSHFVAFHLHTFSIYLPKHIYSVIHDILYN